MIEFVREALPLVMIFLGATCALALALAVVLAAVLDWRDRRRRARRGGLVTFDARRTRSS